MKSVDYVLKNTVTTTERADGMRQRAEVQAFGVPSDIPSK
jgi:hypothetical protein